MWYEENFDHLHFSLIGISSSNGWYQFNYSVSFWFFCLKWNVLIFLHFPIQRKKLTGNLFLIALKIFEKFYHGNLLVAFKFTKNLFKMLKIHVVVVEFWEISNWSTIYIHNNFFFFYFSFKMSKIHKIHWFNNILFYYFFCYLFFYWFILFFFKLRNKFNEAKQQQQLQNQHQQHKEALNESPKIEINEMNGKSLHGDDKMAEMMERKKQQQQHQHAHK